MYYNESSLQLFDICSYDMDSFAEFIQSKGLQSIFTITKNETKELIDDENKRLQFAMRFLKQVLFGEITIPMHENACEQHVTERKEIWSKRK